MFHLRNREAKRELNVYNSNELLLFSPVSTYFGVTLNRLLTFVVLRKKSCLLTSHCWGDLRRWDAEPKHCVQLPYLWPTWQLNTARQSGVAQWTNYRWNTECCKNTSTLRAFISMTNARPVEMSLPRTAWVKGQLPADWCWTIPFFNAQWGLASLLDCECGAIEQTANHVWTVWPMASIRHYMDYMVWWFLTTNPGAGSTPSLPASVREE